MTLSPVTPYAWASSGCFEWRPGVCCWARSLGAAAVGRLRGVLGCALHAGSHCRTPIGITARGYGAAISSWQDLLSNLVEKVHKNILSLLNLVRFRSLFNSAVTSCSLEVVRSHCTRTQVAKRWLKEHTVIPLTTALLHFCVCMD